MRVVDSKLSDGEITSHTRPEMKYEKKKLKTKAIMIE